MRRINLSSLSIFKSMTEAITDPFKNNMGKYFTAKAPLQGTFDLILGILQKSNQLEFFLQTFKRVNAGERESIINIHATTIKRWILAKSSTREDNYSYDGVFDYAFYYPADGATLTLIFCWMIFLPWASILYVCVTSHRKSCKKRTILADETQYACGMWHHFAPS